MSGSVTGGRADEKQGDIKKTTTGRGVKPSHTLKQTSAARAPDDVCS